MELAVTSRGILRDRAAVQEILQSSDAVYEVIRVIDRTPLFLEDHFRRLSESLGIRALAATPEYRVFREKIQELIRLSERTEGNVKFLYYPSDDEYDWIFSFIPHSYPSFSQYIHGVPVGVMAAEREHPNAKVVQAELREKADEMMREQGIYEVLLVNREGWITEGSRSNVFFVRNDIFYTAPADKVLVGITRSKVLECLQDLKCQLVELPVALSAIEDFDAVFLTGTSPKVLPVNRIGHQIFRTDHELIARLMQRYDQMIKESILQA